MKLKNKKEIRNLGIFVIIGILFFVLILNVVSIDAVVKLDNVPLGGACGVDVGTCAVCLKCENIDRFTKIGTCNAIEYDYDLGRCDDKNMPPYSDCAKRGKYQVCFCYKGNCIGSGEGTPVPTSSVASSISSSNSVPSTSSYPCQTCTYNQVCTTTTIPGTGSLSESGDVSASTSASEIVQSLTSGTCNECQACSPNPDGGCVANPTRNGNIPGTEYYCKDGEKGHCYCDYLTSVLGEEYVPADPGCSSGDDFSSYDTPSSTLSSDTTNSAETGNLGSYGVFNLNSIFSLFAVQLPTANTNTQPGLPQPVYYDLSAIVGQSISRELLYSNSLEYPVYSGVSILTAKGSNGEVNPLGLQISLGAETTANKNWFSIPAKSTKKIIINIKCSKEGETQVKIHVDQFYIQKGGIFSGDTKVPVSVGDIIFKVKCNPELPIPLPPVETPTTPTTPSTSTTPSTETPILPSPDSPYSPPGSDNSQTSQQPNNPTPRPLVSIPGSPAPEKPSTPPTKPAKGGCIPKENKPSSGTGTGTGNTGGSVIPIPSIPTPAQPKVEQYFDVLGNLGWSKGGEGTPSGGNKGYLSASAVLGFEKEAFNKLIEDYKNGKLDRKSFEDRILKMPKQVKVQVLFDESGIMVGLFHGNSYLTKEDIINGMFKEVMNKFNKRNLPFSSAEQSQLISMLEKYLPDKLPKGTGINFKTGTGNCPAKIQIGGNVYTVTNSNEINLINKFFSYSLLLRDDFPDGKGLRNSRGEVESTLDRLWRKIQSGTGNFDYSTRLKNGLIELRNPDKSTDWEMLKRLNQA